MVRPEFGKAREEREKTLVPIKVLSSDLLSERRPAHARQDRDHLYEYIARSR